jgi:predicted Rossmann fold nucleotide-binding protein DprA/Smf involved in DNA uptake
MQSNYEKTVADGELPYWMLLEHLPRWENLVTNNLAASILLKENMLLSEFFALPAAEMKERFGLSDEQCGQIAEELSHLDEYREVFARLQEEGVTIVTLNSPFYSKALRHNLMMKSAPLILYCKGNPDLLNKETLAIVGSRKAGEEALDFTDRLARKLNLDGKIVVSGFAKGVDQQALVSSLEAEGQSIIVLPQGILTFKSSMKRYKKQIDAGDLLVVSTYHPDAGWSKGLAMGRNAYIYGLARDIYVAQTESSGGTWSGATEALKKKRRVYIYYSKTVESGALLELVRRGALPIDGNFNPIPSESLIGAPPKKEPETGLLF